MSEKEVKGCCGGHGHEESGCCGGHGDKEGGCGCGNHDHEHKHEHGDNCGCGDEEFQHLVVDLEKEDGTVVTCDIVDSFEYKDEEYVLVEDPEGEVFMFKAVGDEEDGELVVPDEAEFEEVRKYYEESLAEN